MGAMDDDEQTPGAGLDADIEARRRLFGVRLAAARQRRGWSVEDAARRGGISPKTWKRVEDGAPVRAQTFLGLDRAFNVPDGTLIAAYTDGHPIGGYVNIGPTIWDTPHDELPREVSADRPSGRASFLGETANRLPTGVIFEIMLDLTADELEDVFTSAQAIHRTKISQRRQTINLPDPNQFDDEDWPLAKSDDVVRDTWTAFSMGVHRYLHAYQAAEWAYERMQSAEHARRRTDTVENRSMLKVAQESYESAIEIAREIYDAVKNANDTYHRIARSKMGEGHDGEH